MIERHSEKYRGYTLIDEDYGVRVYAKGGKSVLFMNWDEAREYIDRVEDREEDK